MKPLAVYLLSFACCLGSASMGRADDSRQSFKPRTERVARASWTPVRRGNDAGKGNQAVVKAQAVEDLPAPQPKSVLQPAPIVNAPGTAPNGSYFEGPIVDEPIYGGTFFEGSVGDEGFLSSGAACDSMICGGGECGGCGGIGCGSGHHCDSMGCGPGCSNRRGWLPCLTLCLPQDGWFSAEYLLWNQKGMFLPPLATANAINVAPRLAPGLGTRTLFGGDEDYAEGSLDGLRLGFGFFLDHCHEWSVAADYFGWSEIGERAFFVGTPGESLGRPILNAAEGGLPRAQLVNFNGLNADGVAVNVTGTLGIDVASELRSGGFQFRRFLVCRDGCGDTIFLNLPAAFRSRIDLGIGYRYTQLDESLGITESLTFPGAIAPLNSLTMSDRFATRTQFNGFDFGMYYTRHRGCWTLDMQGRFGIGTNNQNVSIRGESIGAINSANGLLATQSNTGTYSRDRISVMPEFRANLGYLITPRLKATVGYTFMYWSNVVRPGDQVDLLVDRNAIPGSPVGNAAGVFPRFQFNETDYWVQGVSFGGEYRW